MIVLWTGAPGSGKSYSAVKLIVDALEAGKCVATNVALADDWALQAAKGNPFRRLVPGRVKATARRWEARTLVSDDLDDLFRVRLEGRGESRGVMVLDEAHNWVNSRTWDTDETGQGRSKGEATMRRLKVVRFFTQHRKLGWDVFLITQSAEAVDAQIRRLFEYHVTLRNLRRFKVVGIPVMPFNFFLALWGWNDAGGSIVKRQAFRLNRRIARLYDSLALSHGLEDDELAPILLPRPKAAEPAGGLGRRPAPAHPNPSPRTSSPAARPPQATQPPDEEGEARRSPVLDAQGSAPAIGHLRLGSTTTTTTDPSKRIRPGRPGGYGPAMPSSTTLNAEKPGGHRASLRTRADAAARDQAGG